MNPLRKLQISAANAKRTFANGMRWLWQHIREPFFAIFLGLATFLVVYAIRDHSFIGDEELGMRDRAQAIRADTDAASVPPPFFMIDFQQKDFAQRGYPLAMPRDVLASVLDFAAKGNPLLIVVDVDLGVPGGENFLKPVISRLAEQRGPRVLFVRQPLASGIDGAPDVVQSTAYDAIVSHSSNLAWVSAHLRPDGDGVARRYFVSRAVHRANTTLLLPGIQPASCAALESSARFSVLQSIVASQKVEMPFGCGGHDWPLRSPDTTSEIIYSMRWMLPEGHRRPQLSIPGRNTQVEEVETVDALDLAHLGADADPRKLLAGRVVIIGSSADHAGDIQNTSIGEMPGMFVVANAIRSARQSGLIARDGMVFSLGVTALMSFITWLVWRVVRRINLGHLIFKDAAAPILNLGWLFAISVLLPTAHCEIFLYPQIVVALLLVIQHGIRERRRASDRSRHANLEEGGI